MRLLPVGVLTTAYCYLPTGEVLDLKPISGGSELAAATGALAALGEKYKDSPADFAEIPRLLNSDRIDLMKEFVLTVQDCDQQQHLDVLLHM